MKFDTHDFRHADEILQNRKAWHELRAVLTKLKDSEIVAEQKQLVATRPKAPVGAQTALNAVIRSKLTPIGWTDQPRLFKSGNPEFRGWKMDFLKERLGVEVSFNHAEAVPWTFTRLNIAGESRDVLPEHRIDVGIAIFATAELKAWGRMDPAVGTFQLAKTWLELMRPIMPIPILVVGLRPDGWKTTALFPGTSKGSKKKEE